MNELIKEFLKITDNMQYGDYARIAMIETLANLAERKNDIVKVKLWGLRQEVINYVEQ